MSLKSRRFGFGQTNWADDFLDIWGIFGQTISTHFSAVSPLFNQNYSTKKLSLSTHILNIYLGLEFELGPQRIRDLAFVCPQSVAVRMSRAFKCLNLSILLERTHSKVKRLPGKTTYGKWPATFFLLQNVFLFCQTYFHIMYYMYFFFS